jgi:diacylglycerol O-acyltransferase / wax synthase
MFERVSADDLMSLASKRHPPPLQVGAVLILDAPGELDIGGLRTVLQQRISAVPRLRQRLQKVRSVAGGRSGSMTLASPSTIT